ncbi:hypothetical protein GCM10018785_06300 [Streptomyces longispororuber]|uniref:Uncharacterized protein n=1 Tax=Streptomyces longispororuber TaxID=68230 RepID=A0A919DDW1_9ACTN|nr:hypothetical protein [Streptomyces longispororuber]GHE39424.1 hypothetical protein GCM10018785_06300 [Streptomyces longispororuber]
MLFAGVPEDNGPYAHMRAALAECPEPRRVLNWLCSSRSARLLADLIATGRQLTHEDLDATATSRSAAMTAEYLRGLLMAYQVLPERDEPTARITRHLDPVTARHPEHAVLLRAYVRWSLLTRARRHQRLRGGGATHRIHWAYTRINLAARFLTAMTARGLTLAEVTQHYVDDWLVGGRPRPATTYAALSSGPTAATTPKALHVPHRPKADPVGLEEDSHWDLLHQCLTDATLPLEVRTAGAILLLFGQDLTRITALTTTALTTVDNTFFLTLDHAPIPLPVYLGHLLAHLARRAASTGWAANTPADWLFPGHLPGAHLSAIAVSHRLTAPPHIPSRPARTTALITLSQDLPPAGAVADVLAFHAGHRGRAR